MPDTSSSLTSFIEGYTATLNPKEMPDGSLLYEQPQEFNFVKLDGTVLNPVYYHIEAARVWPTGYGWVLVQELDELALQMSDGNTKVTVRRYQYLPENYYRNITLYGLVEVT